MSQTVASGMNISIGEEAGETARFVEMCDKWFDAMNVHNFYEGKHTLKDFQKPYEAADDDRLVVC